MGEGKEITLDDWRRRFDRWADSLEEWQGIPIPLQDLPLTLHDRHPMAEKFRVAQQILDLGPDIEIVVGGPSGGGMSLDGVNLDGHQERIRNVFHCRRAQATVYVYELDGRVFHAKLMDSPDHSMARLNLWLHTIGASDAWDRKAEHTARIKLRKMLTERQWRHYDLTGSFLETSERSRLTYVFRRLRPTIAMSPRNRRGYDSMTCIAVLCMHPIGYYAKSWGGCLVPTDDVIAHLTFMRGDEAGYWGQANQHEPWRPEAGI